MVKVSKFKIPFKDGNQLHHETDGGWRDPVEWIDNDPFEDTLVYDSYARGRSAAYFHFIRKSTGKSVVVFMKEFDSMVSHMVNGEITGTFVHNKRGQNYGTAMIEKG